MGGLKMDLSQTEQELYDFINARDGVTVVQIQKELEPKHIGAIGKLFKIEKIVKEKRKKEGTMKLVVHYVANKVEEKTNEAE